MSNIYSDQEPDNNRKRAARIIARVVIVALFCSLRYNGLFEEWIAPAFAEAGNGIKGIFSQSKKQLETVRPLNFYSTNVVRDTSKYAYNRGLELQQVHLYYEADEGAQREYYEFHTGNDGKCTMYSYEIGRYDDKGNCIYLMSAEKDGKYGGHENLERYYLYQYDEEDRVTQSAFYLWDNLIRITDFRYLETGETVQMVRNYLRDELDKETSYKQILDADGQEILRLRLESNKLVEPKESETKEQWTGYNEDGSVRCMLERSRVIGKPDYQVYFTRYEYNEEGDLSAEYIYRWWYGSLELGDEVFWLDSSDNSFQKEEE